MKVYFNSACPVCKAGIESQQRKSSTCDAEWNDIHTNNDAVKEIDSELEFVRERLHVQDEDGRVHVGFDAALEIWRNTKGEAWLASIFGLPVVRHLGRLGYNSFAWCLYRWNRSRNHW